MTRSKQIVGKVAQILNDQEIAINKGRQDGVTLGMEFAVMSSVNPIEIRDPDTNEVIGQHDRVKVNLNVISVDEKYSICRTQRYLTGGQFSSAYMFSDLFGKPQYRQETFNADVEDMPKPISEEDSYVKVGDKVVEVFESE